MDNISPSVRVVRAGHDIAKQAVLGYRLSQLMSNEMGKFNAEKLFI